MTPRQNRLFAVGLNPVSTRRLAIHNGTLEAIKWLALVLMTMDHMNKYLFDQNLPGFSEAGRLAMPLFGFVLAYNLARPEALQQGMYGRAMKRLVFSGLIATPFFMARIMPLANWWPLNIMFTLLVATGTIYLLRRGGVVFFLCALVLFIAGSAFVEFSWFGVGYCIAAWWYCAARGERSLLLWIVTAALLYFINQNFWALAAVPVILLAPHFRIQVPRIRFAFYAYYPVHLAVLLLLRILYR